MTAYEFTVARPGDVVDGKRIVETDGRPNIAIILEDGTKITRANRKEFGDLLMVPMKAAV